MQAYNEQFNSNENDNSSESQQDRINQLETEVETAIDAIYAQLIASKNETLADSFSKIINDEDTESSLQDKLEEIYNFALENNDEELAKNCFKLTSKLIKLQNIAAEFPEENSLIFNTTETSSQQFSEITIFEETTEENTTALETNSMLERYKDKFINPEKWNIFEIYKKELASREDLLTFLLDYESKGVPNIPNFIALLSSFQPDLLEAHHFTDRVSILVTYLTHYLKQIAEATNNPSNNPKSYEHFCEGDVFIEAVRLDQKDLVRILLKINPFIIDYSFFHRMQHVTGLITALQHNNIDHAKLITNYGISKSKDDHYNKLILEALQKSKSDSFLKSTIQLIKADQNYTLDMQKRIDDRSMLWLASIKENPLNKMLILISEGANQNFFRNAQGKTTNYLDAKVKLYQEYSTSDAAMIHIRNINCFLILGSISHETTLDDLKLIYNSTKSSSPIIRPFETLVSDIREVIEIGRKYPEDLMNLEVLKTLTNVLQEPKSILSQILGLNLSKHFINQINLVLGGYQPKGPRIKWSDSPISRSFWKGAAPSKFVTSDDEKNNEDDENDENDEPLPLETFSFTKNQS